MPQSRGPFFDDLGRLLTDASGLAQGVRREIDTAIKLQFERLMGSMDVVTREEFEALREMTLHLRDENEKLAARVAELEAKLDKGN